MYIYCSVKREKGSNLVHKNATLSHVSDFHHEEKHKKLHFKRINTRGIKNIIINKTMLEF